MAAQWARSQANLNQTTILGNPQPPSLVQTKASVLKAASPKSFNLFEATAKPSDTSAQECRTSYKGFGGLRKLQAAQADRTYYEPGCGWRFSMDSGTVNPSVNQGAFGSYKGPVDTQKDKVGGGVKWGMNLQNAERAAATTVAKNLNNSCTNMQYLTAENQQYFGFCKTSGAIIPTQKDSTGKITARFPNDISLGCDSANIVSATSAPGGCSSVANASQGFIGSQTTQGLGVKGDLREAFTSLNQLDYCQPPLTRDCVILAARAAGCGDEGTLITAIEGTSKGQDYSTQLKNNQAFKAYLQTANPGITPALLADGSTSVGTALADFGNVLNNIQSTNPKLAAASKDLCMKKGFFMETYNWCADISPTTIISAENIECVQNHWGNQGGTPQGHDFPTLARWKGKTYQSYLTHVQSIVMNTKSPSKATQSTALEQLFGIGPSYSAIEESDLPMSSEINGAETVWIDLGDYWNGTTPPVILRSDIRMASAGEVIPTIMNDYKDLQQKYHVASATGIAFINAFEYRDKKETDVQFTVTVDDGFMIGVNQNPFEKTTHAQNDWGSWRYQPPTKYTSGVYKFHKDEPKKTNTVITKFFQGQGGAHFQMLLKEGQGGFKDQSKTADARKNMYLTQERDAPWLQFETCTRPNMNEGTKLGFFEKRFNGPVAYYQSKGIEHPIPSFDVDSRGVVVQDGDMPHITFMPSSWWHTRALFAFTAFQTITILVRPHAMLAGRSFAHIFAHIGHKTGTECINLMVSTKDGKNYMFNNGNRSTAPCVPGEWNMVVFQYNGTPGGITNIQMDAMDLPTLQTANGIRAFLSRLASHQSQGSSVIVPVITNASQREHYSGHFVLGGVPTTLKGKHYTERNGFTGDVAWIHGFHNKFTSAEQLEKEVHQTWKSRWPRHNIDAAFHTGRRRLAPRRPECTSSHGHGVILHQQCNEESRQLKVLSVGDYESGSFLRNASYITVPLGFEAVLYTGSIGVGKNKKLVGPTKWSFCSEGGWANKNIKSIRVTPSAGNDCLKNAMTKA